LKGSLPGNAKPIDIVSAVSGSDENVVPETLRIVRNQAWKIMLVDLFDERVLWGDEHVLQQAGLGRRNISEPPTHLEQRGAGLWMYS